MGFGIGIMLGASLLQLILAAQDLQNAAEAPRIYTQAELDEAVEKAVQEALKQSDASSADGAETGGALPDASHSSRPTLSQTESSASQPERIVSFYINPGMSLTAVARSLKHLGLIDDAEEFMDEARIIARNIQPGTSVFSGNPTYDEIIAELTRKKDD
jgi:predicted lipid-binding transport protein (Tim44 family)